MIKPAGYFFTLFYLTGIFFPGNFTGIWAQLSTLSGHLAFFLFALLIARGMHRSSNHFHYFVRLLLSALAVEIISFVVELQLHIHFGPRNALFSYAASLSLVAGISMAVGCYHDMVSHAVPADGEWSRRGLFGVPVNPGNYKMAPIPGMVLGLLTAGLSIFVTLYFDFAEGIFGQLYVLLMFLSLREEEHPDPLLWRYRVFRRKREFTRAFIYSAALSCLFIALSLIKKQMDPVALTVYLMPVATTLIAMLLPERKQAPGRLLRFFSYATLPMLIALLCLLASMM